jgi:exopolysaccharide production protein ExoZ
MLQAAQPAPSEKWTGEARESGATVVTIQYLRAIAASLVVFHHAMAPPALNIYYRRAFGEFGVDLFFVISGYIMWRTTVSGRRRPVEFWAARLVRIVPLYWIFTSLFLAVALLLPQTLSTEPNLDPIFILKSYLFIPAIHPHFQGVVPLYSLGWTLKFEMFFYLLFGASLLIGAPKFRLAALAAALSLLAAIGAIIRPQGPILTTYTDPILLEFLAGVLLAAASRRLMRSGSIWGTILILLGVAWFVQVILSEVPPTRVAAYGVPATMIVAGTLMLEPIARSAPNRLGLLLGDASYSIYLAHPFALRIWLLAAGALFPAASTWTGIAAYVVVAMASAIAASVVCYLMIERPLLAVGHRLIGRHALSGRTATIEANR